MKFLLAVVLFCIGFVHQVAAQPVQEPTVAEVTAAIQRVQNDLGVVRDYLITIRETQKVEGPELAAISRDIVAIDAMYKKTTTDQQQQIVGLMGENAILKQRLSALEGLLPIRPAAVAAPLRDALQAYIDQQKPP